MLDKKTKEELMQLSKEEIIEVYEMLYELYDELGDRIKEAKDFIANNSTISGTFDKNGKMIVESIEKIHNGMRLFDILDKGV